jgi:DNA-binding CsgD family transcriptional regulator
MSSDLEEPSGSPLQRFQELSRELQAQRARLESVTARIRRDVHPLPGSLERLLAIPIDDARGALTQASDVIAESLPCDKVDVFFHDPRAECLVALGTSTTPLGRLQKDLGLDRLPLARGGRAADVFQTGAPYISGRVDQDPKELPEIPQKLGVRSAMIVPVEMVGGRRAVLAVAAAATDAFTLRELQFLEAAAHWVAMLAVRVGLDENSGPSDSTRAAQTSEAGRLTARQREIALLVARGLSNAEIARELVLTPGTVANHIAQMLQRLDFASRTQIAVWAVRNLAPLLSSAEEK